MTKTHHGIILAALLFLSGCAVLDKVVQIANPDTGEVVETTVGDLAADVAEDAGFSISRTVGSVVSVATGNPIMGAGAGAALVALLGAGASRLRKGKS